MRLLYLVFALFYSFTNLHAQALQTEWISTIGGNQFEENNSLAQAPCGDIYTVGYFQDRFGALSSFGTNKEDGFITKYNDLGQLQWVRQLRGSNTDRINGIVITDDESIYISGEFRGTLYYGTDSLTSAGNLDIFVAKLDSSGQFQWAYSTGDRGDDSAYDMDVLQDGTLVLTGYYELEVPWGTADTLVSGSLTSRDVFVAGISSAGTPLWATELRGAGVDECNAIATDTNNCFYIIGSFRDVLYVDNNPSNNLLAETGRGVDVFLVKYDRVGQLEWARSMGGPAGDQGRYVTVDAAQNVLAGGWVSNYFTIRGTSTFLTVEEEEDAFLVKYSPDGTLIWPKIVGRDANAAPGDGGFFDERLQGIATDEHNNIYIVGTVDSLLVVNGDSLRNRHLNRPTDIFVLKYDASGGYKWGQTLGHYYNDFCYDLLVPNSRTLYLVGSYQDTSIFINDTLISQADFDIFLAKFNMDTSLSVRALPANAPALNALLFPNPSAGQSWLQVELEQPTALQITIGDVTGRVLVQQTTALLPAGKQQLMLPNNNWPAGSYFVRVQTEQAVRVLIWVLE
jgi:hypothetical protein